MPRNPLPQQLRDALLQHLQLEADLLQQIQDVSDMLTGCGLRSSDLQNHQADLSGLLGELLQVQLARQDLRIAIAHEWGCEPAAVRLSRIELDTPAATEALERVRVKLNAMTLRAEASLKTAEGSLRGWSGIVSYVLGELLTSGGRADRYTATGQRVASTRGGGIDVRS